MSRKKLIAMYGGCCCKCGYNHSAAALDFDHLNPVEKTRTISHLLVVNQPWAWDAAVEEAKKCQLLCSNCHREKTFPGWEITSPDPESVPQRDQPTSSDPCKESTGKDGSVRLPCPMPCEANHPDPNSHPQCHTPHPTAPASPRDP